MRAVKLKHDVHHVSCQATTYAEPALILSDYDNVVNY